MTHSIAKLLATGLGLGYVPKAPGTAGSAGAFFLAWSAYDCGLTATAWYGIAVGLTGVAVWSAGVVARKMNHKDPQIVVIDEVAGQWIACAGFSASARAYGLIFGFLLFRAADIIKPFGIRRLERLRGGWGIVLDDVAAGILVNALLHGVFFYCGW